MNGYDLDNKNSAFASKQYQRKLRHKGVFRSLSNI